jgi:hypothetical protein
LARGVPGQGVVVEVVKGVKYAPLPPEMYENDEKWVVCLNVLAYKSLKKKLPFFISNVLHKVSS